jgi:hypothetical protein
MLETGADAEMYLVFRVLKNGGKVPLNQPLKVVGEIEQYSTSTDEENPSGQIDRDSAPGSAIFGDRSTYEDDTDDAPEFTLTIGSKYTGRKITGKIFNDLDGNGIMDGGDSLVPNAKVVIYERIYNLDAQTRTATDPENYRLREVIRYTVDSGEYSIPVPAGDYEVEFIYGHTDMLQSTKKYNAQDYQSTKYTSIEGVYNEDDLVTVLYNSIEQTESGMDLVAREDSAAKDDIVIRADTMENAVLIQYEKGTLLDALNGEGGVSADQANKLSGGNNGTERVSEEKVAKSKYQNSTANPNYTYMQAYSERVEVVSNDIRGRDIVINFGIKERPQTLLDTYKKAARIQIVTNDGVSIIDTNDVSKVENLREFPHTEGEDYKREIFLDESIMQGARIIVDYDITVTNNGQPDKISNYLSDAEDVQNAGTAFGDLMKTLEDTFHEKIEIEDVLPVRPDIIYDYVHTNFEYRLEDNDSALWQRIYQRTTDGTDLTKEDNTVTTLLGQDVQNGIKEGIDFGNKKSTKTVSNIVKSDSTNTSVNNLTPVEGDNVMTIKSQLSMSLAAAVEMETQGEDFLYKNAMEVVQRSSGAGRRDYEAVPGNDVPYGNGDHEPDYSETKDFVVRTPDGGILGLGVTGTIIAAVASVLVVIALGTAGVVIYKKKHM